MTGEPEALAAFEVALSGLCWHDHPSHGAVALRRGQDGRLQRQLGFPRLTKADVPAGVLDVDYLIALPGRRSAAEEDAP